jgi:hypothetical protein
MADKQHVTTSEYNADAAKESHPNNRATEPKKKHKRKRLTKEDVRRK